MTTIKEEFENFTAKCGDAGDKIIGYSIIESNLNILREAAEEIRDYEIRAALDELIELMDAKSNELLETEIE